MQTFTVSLMNPLGQEQIKKKVAQLMIFQKKFEKRLIECEESQRAILEIAIQFIKEQITLTSRELNRA